MQSSSFCYENSTATASLLCTLLRWHLRTRLFMSSNCCCCVTKVTKSKTLVRDLEASHSGGRRYIEDPSPPVQYMREMLTGPYLTLPNPQKARNVPTTNFLKQIPEVVDDRKTRPHRTPMTNSCLWQSSGIGRRSIAISMSYVYR